MEGAARVFAGEFGDADLWVPDTGNARTGCVVTPGGAWCRSVFLAGALTEVTDRGDCLSCRLADPTGAFDLVVASRESEVFQAFGRLPVPAFVTVTGTAQISRRNGGTAAGIRPDTVRQVDRAVRDRWVVRTAEITAARLEVLGAALDAGSGRDPRSDTVIRHYAITLPRIRALASMAGSAVAGLPPTPAATASAEQDVRGMVMAIMQEKSGPRGVSVEEVIGIAAESGIGRDAVLSALEILVQDDECYQPQKGYVRPL